MEKDYYTFILIPHSPDKKTFSLKVPRWFVHVSLFSVVAAFVIFTSSFIYSSHVARRLVSYEDLKVKALTQNKQIDKFSNKADLLVKELDDLVSRENQIRKMLGLKMTAQDLKLTVKGRAENKEDVEKKLKMLNNNVKARKYSLANLMKFAAEFRKRFANMPSIWPSSGRIMSTFGYRTSPWRGFHSGIDINAGYGSPIRTAANGVVSFVGWRTGYGKTVIVDHGFGYQTLYGHASGFAVSSGQRVKKGQVVAYIGMTGFATGPHVHYEVIRNGVCINPMHYLGLNLLTSAERR